MNIKTIEFDTKFKNDLQYLSLISKKLIFKGSYKILENNDIITDIDITALVFYNFKLLDIIVSLINLQPSPFRFIKMSCGLYNEYIVPWKIGTRGDCFFNLEQTRSWFSQFKNKDLIPPNYKQYIENKLKEPLILRNLIDIENILHKYGQILWFSNDIGRGYIIHNNIQYNLLDIMKTETPVLEFIYHYKDCHYIPIDLGLVDNKYKSEDTQQIYRFYMDDWYKIMKIFRWKIISDEKKKYIDVMRTITPLISLKYQLTLAQNIIKYKLLPPLNFNLFMKCVHNEILRLNIPFENKNYDQIEEYIYELINNKLKDSVEYFLLKLMPEYKNPYYLLQNRILDSKISVSEKEIMERERLGIKCPFFSTDIDNYESIYTLSKRIDIDLNILINCFTTMALKYNKSLDYILNIIGKNKLYLEVIDNKILLQNDTKLIGKYNILHKKQLQSLILLFK